ncbi:hypothetical protein [Streptomyces tubercidicus]
MNITFDALPGFREMPIGLGVEEARDYLQDRAAEHGQVPPAAQIDAIASDFEKSSALLAASGVVYAATCLGTIDGDLSTGTLTLGLSPLGYNAPEVAVEGIRQVMAAKHENSADTHILTLPCGQAALVIRQVPALKIPAEVNRTGEDIPIDVAQIQAFIPVPQTVVPGAQTLATVTFSTPSIDHWADYCALLVPFLNSLRFLPDPEGEADAPSAGPTPAGLPVPSAAGSPAMTFG